MGQPVVSNFSLWDMRNLVCEDGCFVYGTIHGCRMAGDPRVKYLSDSFVVYGSYLLKDRDSASVASEVVTYNSS